MGDSAVQVFPPPWVVFQVMTQDAHRLVYHLGSTLLWTFSGFTLALVGGFFGAILLHKSKIIEKITWPLIIFSQTIPTVFLAPLFILWFGFGPGPRVITVFISCIFPILVNFLSGLEKVPRGFKEMLATHGASENQIFWILDIPMAIPSLLTGVKLSLTYALVACVLSEWIGAQDGLGMYMALSFKNFTLEKSFAAVIILAGVSFLLVTLLKKIEFYINTKLRRIG